MLKLEHNINSSNKENVIFLKELVGSLTLFIITYWFIFVYLADNLKPW